LALSIINQVEYYKLDRNVIYFKKFYFKL